MAIRLFDIIFTLTFIIVLFPVMILTMILCSLFIEFQPFYYSKRVGKAKKEYTHIKFKSMRSGSEKGRVFFELDRINFFGKIIRKYHLDKLPELFLILTGKMSFVGPRPLPKKLLKGLHYENRCTVLPGNTGLAQIWLLKNGQLDKHLQIRLDDLYVKKRSFIYNIKIILATIWYFVKKKKLDLDPGSNLQRVEYNE